MGKRDKRIDQYIAQRAAFARLILSHVRAAVHATCPAVEEAIKWGMPWFCYRGKLMCHMAGFTKHAAFGFYRSTAILGPRGKRESMGVFGRLTSVGDLPNKRVLAGYIRKAMAIADGTLEVPRRKRTPRPLPKTPPDLAAALRADAVLRERWAAFSAAMRREYLEWMLAAKQAETRARRLALTIAQVREGKSLNWKYQSKPRAR